MLNFPRTGEGLTQNRWCSMAKSVNFRDSSKNSRVAMAAAACQEQGRMEGEWLNQGEAGAKRGLKRQEMYSQEKSWHWLTARKGGTRKDRLRGGGVRKGTAEWDRKGQQAQPSASSQPLPHITTAASADALHVILPWNLLLNTCWLV